MLPTGRLIGEREPYALDFDRLIAAAQRAALCYEIVATILGDKATSMMRLGDTYAGLAEDFDKPRTDVWSGEGPGLEKVTEIRRAVLER